MNKEEKHEECFLCYLSIILQVSSQDSSRLIVTHTYRICSEMKSRRELKLTTHTHTHTRTDVQYSRARGSALIESSLCVKKNRRRKYI